MLFSIVHFKLNNNWLPAFCRRKKISITGLQQSFQFLFGKASHKGTIRNAKFLILNFKSAEFMRLENSLTNEGKKINN